MPSKLPPLRSLEAFVAVGSTLSVKVAADMLRLTPSAVSHRLRALEDHLGIQLFERLNRALRLTGPGERYLRVIRSAFERMEEGTHELQEGTLTDALPVYVVQALAATWILSQLSDFYARHPDIRLTFHPQTSREYPATKPTDLRGSVQIRFGRGEWPGFHCERIVSCRSFPVCSPALLKAPDALREPADLARHVWLHVSLNPQAWPDWLQTAGVPDLRPRENMQLDDAELKHQAAVHGLGVAIGFDVLVDPYLRSGELVAPFDIVHQSRDAYYLVCHPEDRLDPRIRAFADWLKERGAAYLRDLLPVGVSRRRKRGPSLRRGRRAA